MHYDDVHMAKYLEKGGRKTRENKEYQVFRSVVSVHQRKLCQMVCLPANVKQILRQKKDETNWQKLQDLRRAILDATQGLRHLVLDEGGCKELAKAIDRTPNDFFWDDTAIAVGDVIPAGSRIHTPLGEDDHKLDSSTKRGAIADRVRMAGARTISVLTRPFGCRYQTRRPPISPFCKQLAASKHHIQEFAGMQKPKPLNQQEILDELLVTLWDALHLDFAINWSEAKVANIPATLTFEMGRYFMRGLDVAEQPIFTGMCSFCAGLLYGNDTDSGSLTNSKKAPPVTKDGHILSDGSVEDAQPPCLLRYSPSLFAKEAPEVFGHDPETNRLSFKPGAKPPWIHHSKRFWLYCNECYELLHNKATTHVPFRDKASQGNLLTGDWRQRKQKHEEMEEGNGNRSSQPPPGEEAAEEAANVPVALPFAGEEDTQDDFGAGQDDPIFESQPPEDDGKGEALAIGAGVEEDEETAIQEAPLPELPEECDLPTLEEYQGKWETLFARHNKSVSGAFGPGNLCPKPVPQLWSDCPYVAFDRLVSNESQGRLSMCKPISGLQGNSVVNGVERYAHILGDVHFCRRAAWQLASTMGFIVRKNSGNFMRLRPEERRALHECMRWGTQRGRLHTCPGGCNWRRFCRCALRFGACHTAC